MDERPEMSFPQPQTANAAPVAAKKKSRKGWIIGLAVALVLLIAAAVFLLSYFSADARFDRAMQEEAFDAAEEILAHETLRPSEQNDAHYLALAERHLEAFRRGTEDYAAAAQSLRTLRAADTYLEETRTELAACQSGLIEAKISEISDAYNSRRLDYTAAMQSILALKAEEDLPEDMREKVESCERAVLESHLTGICEAYRIRQIDYDAAAAQIGESNPFEDATAAELVSQYLAKLEQTRETLYADTLNRITAYDSDDTAADILAALSPFGAFRNAETLRGIYESIQAGDGVEAARLLLAYRDQVLASEDALDAEASLAVFDAVKSEIRSIYLNADTAWDDYRGKLDNRIRLDYVDELFEDSASKITSLFGSESSRALSLGRELDMDLFSVCKGGTGKILYIAHYLNSSSGDSYDTYYYHRYENLKDIPLAQMPASLEEVEYLVLYEYGGKFYSNYSYNDGTIVKVYRRTVQATVIQYPSGEVIYDSGVLSGPTPNSTMTVFTGTKYAYGDDPDLTEVKEAVRELIGLT